MICEILKISHTSNFLNIINICKILTSKGCKFSIFALFGKFFNVDIIYFYFHRPHMLVFIIVKFTFIFFDKYLIKSEKTILLKEYGTKTSCTFYLNPLLFICHYLNILMIIAITKYLHFNQSLLKSF